ncbi:MAG: DUF167 domain-containing protein [Hyphomicrobiaceae bacterium]|nr:MAG: DUF167 domain-containing protein [Hyphomicrobiaceae bacterium]
MQAWTAVDGGARVRVRLTPRSGRDAVEGVEATAEGPALKVRVRAVPEKGEANAALAATLARWLDVPKSTVEVAAGSKSRCKTLFIAGQGAELCRRIAARLADDGQC